MKPVYDLDKIKFATDQSTFQKAVEIYNTGGIKDFEDISFGFEANVRGSKVNYYKVYVSAKNYDHGACDCYLGEQNILCKHLVAMAIYAVKGGGILEEGEIEIASSPICSSRVGELSKEELVETKAAITSAMRYIKPYKGPSRIWFAYQNSLCEGRARLSKLVSELPISEQTAKLLVDMLLRLDKKICTGGVDDSDGTVGGFMEEVVSMLQEYAKLDFKCIKAFEKLCSQETCFGWEGPLVKIFDEQ